MAAAVGEPTRIPFVIGLLSRVLNNEDRGQRPDILNAEMQDLLDAGPSVVPTSHLYAWWLGDAAPASNKLLNGHTLHTIMQSYYQDEAQHAPSHNNRHSCPSSTSWTNEREQELLDVPHGIRQRIVHAERETHKKIILSQRRASGFHQLWEAVLQKEAEDYTFAASATAASAASTQTPIAAPSANLNAPPTGKRGTKDDSRHKLRSAARRGRAAVEKIPAKLTNRELADMFTEFSATELRRMQQSPAIKWTWGPDLTEADVSRIVRAADNDFRIPHSDYDMSLPMGNLYAGSSSNETRGDDYFEDSMPQATISQSIIPDLASDDIPTHFASFPLRRPRSAIPEGLIPFNAGQPSTPVPTGTSEQKSMKTSIDKANLLYLARSAINEWNPDAFPIDTPATDAAAAEHPSRPSQQPSSPEKRTQMLRLATASLEMSPYMSGQEEWDHSHPIAAAAEYPSRPLQRSFSPEKKAQMLLLATRALEMTPSMSGQEDLDNSHTIAASAESPCHSVQPPASAQKMDQMFHLATAALQTSSLTSGKPELVAQAGLHTGDAAEAGSTTRPFQRPSSQATMAKMLHMANTALAMSSETSHSPAAPLSIADSSSSMLPSLPLRPVTQEKEMLELAR